MEIFTLVYTGEATHRPLTYASFDYDEHNQAFTLRVAHPKVNTTTATPLTPEEQSNTLTIAETAASILMRAMGLPGSWRFCDDKTFDGHTGRLRTRSFHTHRPSRVLNVLRLNTKHLDAKTENTTTSQTQAPTTTYSSLFIDDRGTYKLQLAANELYHTPQYASGGQAYIFLALAQLAHNSEWVTDELAHYNIALKLESPDTHTFRQTLIKALGAYLNQDPLSALDYAAYIDTNYPISVAHHQMVWHVFFEAIQESQYVPLPHTPEVPISLVEQSVWLTAALERIKELSDKNREHFISWCDAYKKHRYDVSGDETQKGKHDALEMILNKINESGSLTIESAITQTRQTKRAQACRDIFFGGSSVLLTLCRQHVTYEHYLRFTHAKLLSLRDSAVATVQALHQARSAGERAQHYADWAKISAAAADAYNELSALPTLPAASRQRGDADSYETPNRWDYRTNAVQPDILYPNPGLYQQALSKTEESLPLSYTQTAVSVTKAAASSAGAMLWSSAARATMGTLTVVADWWRAAPTANPPNGRSSGGPKL